MTKKFFILNFFRLYNILWALVLPFLAKHNRLKPGFSKRVHMHHHRAADIWIQAASAGEAYLAVHLIKTLVPKKPTKILATTITQQGMDILKSQLTKTRLHPLIQLKIEWSPFDKPSIIKQAVHIIHPEIMILLETEIWPALLWYLKLNRTRIYIVNARLSAKSVSHYQKSIFLWKHLAPDMVLATSDLYADRYRQIFKTARVHTMSNIKFESMDSDQVDNDKACKQIETLLPESLPLTVLASIREPEEKDVLKILNAITTEYPDQVVAVFPRHMHRICAWEKHFKRHKLNYRLKSCISSPVKAPQIILWDTFGELKTVYPFARVVFVGASLKPLGGQNFIEPAITGAVTITGPYYDDFAWAADTINEHIIIKKDNWTQVKNAIVNALENPCDRSCRKQKAFDYILSRRGGTRTAWKQILKAFDE